MHYIIRQPAECNSWTLKSYHITCRENSRNLQCAFMEPAECIHGTCRVQSWNLQSAVLEPATCNHGTCRVQSWNPQFAFMESSERNHGTCRVHLEPTKAALKTCTYDILLTCSVRYPRGFMWVALGGGRVEETYCLNATSKLLQPYLHAILSLMTDSNCLQPHGALSKKISQPLQ